MAEPRGEPSGRLSPARRAGADRGRGCGRDDGGAADRDDHRAGGEGDGRLRAALAVREGSDRLRTIAAHGLTPSEAQRWATLELAERSPLTDAVLTSQVVTITSRAELLERYPGLGDRTEGSSVTLPLISRTDGSVVGALGFRFDGRVGAWTPMSCGCWASSVTCAPRRCFA